MLKQQLVLVAAICLLCHSVCGDTKPSQLTKFRPISQSEYEAILSLTDGKPVVSEGRLINSGLAALAGLTSGWVTSLRFPNIFGALGLSEKSPSDSYPLCVIKTDDEEHRHDHEHYDQHDHYDHRDHHEHHRRTDAGYESSEADYSHYSHGYHTPDHSYEIASHEHHENVEVMSNKNKLSPVVNCIVVLREDNHHTTTTAKRPKPKRSRKKHRRYPPPPPPPLSPPPPPSAPSAPSAPTTAYPYSAPPSTYAVQPPAGSYNNPWYWQSLYYNPYYSDPRAHTGIYPGAYPDIYATIYPGAYPGNYPGSFPDAFAAFAAGNNPNPYYDSAANTFSDTPTSADPSDSYNSQPSSYTSTYPSMEISVMEAVPTASLDANYYQNFESSYEGVEPMPSVSSPQAGYTAQFEGYRSDGRLEAVKSKRKTSKNTATSKVSGSSLKTKSKHSLKSRPKNEMSVAQTASTKVTPPATATRRHTKAKRDEAGAQSQTHSYAKIASYTQGGYQPTLYPQNSYQSDYPKVSHIHALPYPAPVYVGNRIEQQSAASTNMKHQQVHEADSEEDEDSAEFIQVRMNH